MSKLNEIAGEIERIERGATKGPWRWFNGCSWWRLGNDDRDTAVLYPTKDRDGHPNLCVQDDDKELIATLRNHTPLIVAALRECEAWRRRAGPHAERGPCPACTVKIDEYIAATDAAVGRGG